ncbi:restriction endonuclease subunit S [Helicobacter pylori]|uniref:restriction endonuclease subunit S n=1 Tax=Helicobacter pylori TaxID=210 RepID=UPI000FDE3696|nr:restriction endonuclease subunit S [Helicobacter pylori]RVZ95290.1 restriction endonuclease subunit S [Helicobacter pylori]WQW96457.1 restriction endonuclease subunit S [Helicobacter pylori]
MDALATPSNWQRVRLGDIAEIKRGVRITKNELDVFGKYPVVSGGVGFLGYTNNFNRYENTITIAQYGTAGYVNFQKNKFWANDICFCVYSNKDVIKNIFLYYFLKVNQNYLYEISNRNATPYSISKDKILDFEILLPPLNEQIAIANILSDVDHYLYSLDALILKKESVKKALSFELLSQRKRLKGFNQAWQRVKVKDFGIIITGSTPLTQISEYWNGTISWITPTDINDNKDIFNSERKITQKGLDTIRMIPKNSVLVTCIASIGKNAILRVNGACNQQINAIIPNKDFNADFIYYLMENNKQYLLGKAGVTATYIISKQVFEEIDFFVPKDLDEQIAIANILSDLDSEIISLKNKKRQFDNIKKALNHDLMSAKIRVLKQ